MVVVVVVRVVAVLKDDALNKIEVRQACARIERLFSRGAYPGGP